MTTSSNKYLFTYCSSSVRIYHDFCGSVSACTIFCASEQLGWDSIRCSKIYMWNQTCCCWESRKYRNLVSNTWHVSSIGGHNECKNNIIEITSHPINSLNMTLYSIMIIILSLLLIKAFLIAFTSEFIQKLVYKYQYNWNMEGYLNFTLAQSPMENWGDRNLTMCRYQAFRDDTGKYTMVHWQVLALKLAFVICFEVRTSTWKKIAITAYCFRY